MAAGAAGTRRRVTAGVAAGTARHAGGMAAGKRDADADAPAGSLGVGDLLLGDGRVLLGERRVLELVFEVQIGTGV